MFKISCDEATTICDKNQYGEASFLERIKLSLHILMCKFCALYLKQNKTLTKVYKMKSVECKKEGHDCLSKQDKEAFKKELEKINI